MAGGILQINVTDFHGGSGRVCRSLHDAYRGQGLSAWLAAGRVGPGGEGVLPIPARQHGGFQTVVCAGATRLESGGGALSSRMAAGLRALAHPWRSAWARAGVEDFDFPGIYRLLDRLPFRPSVIHAHNLQGDYFDLRALPRLSAIAPLLVTLHDSWLFTGHCSHGLGCERWRSGCGKCPDLTIYPPIRADGTRGNWRRKQAILAAAAPHLVAPSEWMRDQVAGSLLAPLARSVRVIPNGVDVARFAPGERADARAATGLPRDDVVLLGVFKPRNRFKDFNTMRLAAIQVAEAIAPRRVTLVIVGGEAGREHTGRLRIVRRAGSSDDASLVLYYRAADVCLHAAHAENFPMAILEAMACGRPVVASAVGGIPEQVRTLVRCNAHAPHRRERSTGILVPESDARRMAAAMLLLLGDPGLAAQLGKNAARVAARHFTLARQVDAHLDLYEELEQAAAPGTRTLKR